MNDSIPDMAGPKDDGFGKVAWSTPPHYVKSAYKYFAIITDEDDIIMFVKAPAVYDQTLFLNKLEYFMRSECGVRGEYEIYSTVPQSVAKYGQLTWDEYDELMNGRMQSRGTAAGGHGLSNTVDKYH